MNTTAQNTFLELVRKLVELENAGYEVWLGWNGRDGLVNFSVGDYMAGPTRLIGGELSVKLEGLKRAFGGK